MELYKKNKEQDPKENLEVSHNKQMTNTTLNGQRNSHLTNTTGTI